MKWFFKVLRQYADFSGRASREEFWMFVLFNFIFSLAYSLVTVLLTYLLHEVFHLFPVEERVPEFIMKLLLLYYSIMLIPSMAVIVRRLHDTGRSGWMMLVSLIPLVGGIWLFVLYVLPGNPESNKYGSVPESNISSGQESPLKYKALDWIIAMAFFSFMLEIYNMQHMVSDGYFAVEEAFSFSIRIFQQLTYLLFDIALIIMAIGLWQKKVYSRTIAVWLFIGTIPLLIFQLYFITIAEAQQIGAIFFSLLWIICIAAIAVYAGFLFIRKGKQLIAIYILMTGSICWIIRNIVIYIQNIKMLKHGGFLEPNYFLHILLLIIPISILLYSLEIRKESIASISDQ